MPGHEKSYTRFLRDWPKKIIYKSQLTCADGGAQGTLSSSTRSNWTVLVMVVEVIAEVMLPVARYLLAMPFGSRVGVRGWGLAGAKVQNTEISRFRVEGLKNNPQKSLNCHTLLHSLWGNEVSTLNRMHQGRPTMLSQMVQE